MKIKIKIWKRKCLNIDFEEVNGERVERLDVKGVLHIVRGIPRSSWNCVQQQVGAAG